MKTPSPPWLSRDKGCAWWALFVVFQSEYRGRASLVKLLSSADKDENSFAPVVIAG
jgi:hypothetical protein